MRSDAELLEAWQAGDRRAANELVDRHFAAISRFFRNKVRSDDDGAELVSQTFLACTQGRDRYRGDASVRQFLFSIAHKVLLQYIRAQVKRGREVGDFAEVCVQDAFPATLSSIVMHRREAQSFVQALREIPVDDQVVLELMYFEGLSGAEIAELLGLPEGTIRGRVARGKQRLKSRIDAVLTGGGGEVGALDPDRLDAWAREVRASQGWGA
ncbi:MAG: RNA polymerase sigma factor [Nannocystaceae bacterium]